MNAPTTMPPATLPLELLAAAAALAAGFLVNFGWRGLLKKLKAGAARPGIDFLLRLGLPASLLLSALVLEHNPWTASAGFSPDFGRYTGAAVIFLAVVLGIRAVDAALDFRFARRRRPFPVPGVLRGFFLAVIYIVVLFVVLKEALGINITPFLATSAIFTAIIGLALQGVLGNVLAGISLNLTKSFGRGDWVSIGPHEGVVMDTNWRETLLLDRASNVVVIPNSAAAAEKIVNFARPDAKTALNISLMVSPSAPAARVVEILKEAAREVPEVLSAPAPQAYIMSYDNLGISYLVKFWVTDFARKFSIRGDVARHIWYKFRRDGIEIPVALTETVRQAVGGFKTGEVPGVEDPAASNFAVLLQSQLFRAGEAAGELLVPADDVRQLAALARRRAYTKGEVVFRQGDRGESCFIVASGLIRGEVIYEENGQRFTSEFKTGPGGLFGEMSLFTGLPRTATGIVEEQAELLEITAADFARLLERNPGTVEAVAGLVSERNRKNAEFLGKIKELSARDVEDSGDKNWILARLRKLASLFRGHQP